MEEFDKERADWEKYLKELGKEIEKYNKYNPNNQIEHIHIELI